MSSKENLRKQIEKLKDRIDELEQENNGENSNPEKISRRKFLKAVGSGAAGMGALAMLPSTSAFEIRSDKGLNFFSNGKKFGMGPSGSIEGEELGRQQDRFETVYSEAVRASNLSGRIYVNEKEGSSIDEKLKNAIKDASPGSTLVIPPRQDGTKYSWNSDVKIDPNKSGLNGGTLVIERGARISLENYSGSEAPLVLETSKSSAEQRDKGQQFMVELGRWFGNGKDTDICIVRDMLGTEVKNGFATDTEGFLVAFENVDEWCENNYVENLSTHLCEGTVDFRPASVTGGSGTGSFRATKIKGIWCDFPDTAGLRFRGNVYSSNLDDIHVNLDGAKSAAGVILDGNFPGTSASTWRIETLKNREETSETGIKKGSNYAERTRDRLTVDNLFIPNKVATRITGPDFLFSYQSNDGYQTFYKDNDKVYRMNPNSGGINPGGFNDLRGSTHGEPLIRLHNGKGEVPRGPCMYNSIEEVWVSLVDGTEFT